VNVAHNLEDVLTGYVREEAVVDDRSRAIAAAVVGAVAGGIGGYMLFTERGRELRKRLEPALEDFAQELVQLRGTVNRAVGVASQGWHVLNEALGERGSSNAFPTHHQSNPF